MDPLEVHNFQRLNRPTNRFSVSIPTLRPTCPASKLLVGSRVIITLARQRCTLPSYAASSFPRALSFSVRISETLTSSGRYPASGAEAPIL